jgi:hypothetical protein
VSRALTLADYAAVEAEGRERYYPDEVRRGAMTADEAEHDWRCWVAISEFFKGPADYQLPQLASFLTWGDLAHAATKALRRREHALAENRKPELAWPLGDRRDAVAAMAWRLERRARYFAKMTRELRAAASDRRNAKRPSPERKAA